MTRARAIALAQTPNRMALKCLMAAGVLGMCLVVAQAVQAAEPPTQVTSTLTEAKRLGGHKFTWFGLHVYDAQLWSTVPAKQFDYTKHGSWLELTYARDFKGADIAERSREEMAEQGSGTEAQRTAWEKKLAEVFPDVKKGESLSALYQPGKPLQFFHNGKPLAEIADLELSRAFMGIWLDTKTSEPKMRKKLLGL